MISLILWLLLIFDSCYMYKYHVFIMNQSQQFHRFWYWTGRLAGAAALGM